MRKVLYISKVKTNLLGMQNCHRILLLKIINIKINIEKK